MKVVILIDSITTFTDKGLHYITLVISNNTNNNSNNYYYYLLQDGNHGSYISAMDCHRNWLITGAGDGSIHVTDMEVLHYCLLLSNIIKAKIFITI